MDKELMDCRISNQLLGKLHSFLRFTPLDNRKLCYGCMIRTANAQLNSPKLLAYIEAVKKAERESVFRDLAQIKRDEVGPFSFTLDKGVIKRLEEATKKAKRQIKTGGE